MPSDNELQYTERNRKWSQFAMTPGAEPLLKSLEDCATALKLMVRDFEPDDETFEHAKEGLEDALHAMQRNVREEIGRRRHTFR